MRCTEPANLSIFGVKIAAARLDAMAVIPLAWFATVRPYTACDVRVHVMLSEVDIADAVAVTWSRYVPPVAGDELKPPDAPTALMLASVQSRCTPTAYGAAKFQKNVEPSPPLPTGSVGLNQRAVYVCAPSPDVPPSVNELDTSVM